MSIIILSNHSATDKLCVTFYKFYNAFMIFSQFITYTSTLYDLQGVTCTFHPNISPCVNLKNVTILFSALTRMFPKPTFAP